MKFLAWIGDVIWVYLIPLFFVSTTLGMGLSEWAHVLVLGVLGTLFIALLIGARVLIWATERRPATPEFDG